MAFLDQGVVPYTDLPLNLNRLIMGEFTMIGHSKVTRNSLAGPWSLIWSEAIISCRSIETSVVKLIDIIDYLGIL